MCGSYTPGEIDGVSATTKALHVTIEKPKKIKIIGEEKDLKSLVEQFAGIWKVCDKNRVQYRDT